MQLADALESRIDSEAKSAIIPDAALPEGGRTTPATAFDRGLSGFDSELLREVNEASGTARHSSLFFMALAAYCYVTLVGISHKDLLLNTMVDLPVLQVKIPQRSFAVFAPLLLVLVHFGILLQHITLSRMVRELDKRLLDREKSGWRDPWRLVLNSYGYTQAFAGRFSSRLVRISAHAMTRIPLGIVPIMLLLLFQIVFLPYHDPFITNFHRGYLLADVILVALSTGLLGHPERPFFRGMFMIIREHPFMFLALMAFWLTALAISLLVATVPDEYVDRKLRLLPPPFTAPVPIGSPLAEASRTAFFPTACLFEPPAESHWCSALKIVFTRLKRNLDVNDTVLVSNKDSEQLASVSLRDRNLQYARLERSDLRNVNLTNVDMSDANVSGANLAGARLVGALLVNAKMQDTYLQGADLSEAKLDRAILNGAMLAGANLTNTSLVDAQLKQAHLPAATLRGANLTNAILDGADLRLASLHQASVTGSELSKANTLGADLRVKSPVLSSSVPDNSAANTEHITDLWIELACSDGFVNTPILRQLLSHLRSPDSTDYAYTIDRRRVIVSLFREDCGAARRIALEGDEDLRSAFEALRWQNALGPAAQEPRH
jgi:uncharacterized protein YjbI with pentapeptide repeats